jgi:hypothetical protein
MGAQMGGGNSQSAKVIIESARAATRTRNVGLKHERVRNGTRVARPHPVRGVLGLVEAHSRQKPEYLLSLRVQPAEFHVADVDSSANVEALHLHFTGAVRRIDVVELLSLDLRKEADLRVKVNRGRGRTGANQDGRFEPLNPFAPEPPSKSTTWPNSA